jgi:MFS family permease
MIKHSEQIGAEEASADMGAMKVVGRACAVAASTVAMLLAVVTFIHVLGNPRFDDLSVYIKNVTIKNVTNSSVLGTNAFVGQEHGEWVPQPNLGMQWEAGVGYSASQYVLAWGSIGFLFAVLVLCVFGFVEEDVELSRVNEGTPLLGEGAVLLLDDAHGREEVDLEVRSSLVDHSTRERSTQYDRVSMALVCFLTLSNSIDYAVKMPTINGYITSFGGTTMFLGLVLAAFMVGRTLLFMALGFWGDRRGLKEPFLFAQIIVILGELLYVAADSFCEGEWQEDNACSIPASLGATKDTALGLILVGRLVSGMGGAVSTLCKVYISRTTSQEDRTGYMSFLTGLWMIGLLLGPAFAAACKYINFQVGMFRFNENTLPGHIMIAMNLISVVLFHQFFKNPVQADDKAQVCCDFDIFSKACSVLRSRGGWYCLMVNFMIYFEISGFETVATPLTRRWSWGQRENSWFFGYLAISGLLAIASTSFLERCLKSDMRIMVVAFAITSSSFVVGFAISPEGGFPEWELFLWSGLFMFGNTLMVAPNLALYTTAVGEDGAGFFVGIFETICGISQISGPIAAAAAFGSATSEHYTLLSILLAPLVIALLFFPVAWGQLGSSGAGTKEQRRQRRHDA